MLAEYKKDKDTYKSAKNERLNVKSFGPNVTVVAGRAREKGTGKDGKAFDRTFLFTDTWILRNGQWQCVASQIEKVKGLSTLQLIKARPRERGPPFLRQRCQAI